VKIKGAGPMVPTYVHHPLPAFNIVSIDHTRDSGADSRILKVVQRLDGFVEAALHVSETVVDLFVRAVDADPDTVKTGLGDPDRFGLSMLIPTL
jgi:hypothetical protein